MGVTVPELKRVRPSFLATVAGDFGTAHSWYSDAQDSFNRQVAGVVESGADWTGGGQLDAAVVVQINASALAISTVEMQAAKAALNALAVALATAQRRLTALELEASKAKVKINDDGSCEKSDDVRVTPGPMGHPDPGVGATLAATELEPKVKGVLVYASTADTTCHGLLDRIATHTPEYSQTADRGVLARNGRTLAEALSDRNLAAANEKFWSQAKPTALPQEPGPVESLFDGVGNFFSHLADNPDEAQTLLVDALAIDLGVGLAALGAGAEIGGVALDLTVAGAVVGVPINVASAGFIASGAVTAGAGVAKLGSDLSRMNSEAQSEASGGAGSAKPRPPQNVKKLLEHLDKHNGAPPKGYKGTKPYKNQPEPGDQKLPENTSTGEKITYKEYDVNKRTDMGRDQERLVIGSDGRVWYTADHFHTFIPVR